MLAYFSYFIRNIDLRYNVGFEALTAVVMKTYIFWDITPCSPLKVSRRFGGICHHLQRWRVSQDRNQHATGSKKITCLAYSLTLKMPLHAACLILVSCFAYSSNPKIESRFSSETSVDFQQTTLRCTSEDRTHMVWWPCVSLHVITFDSTYGFSWTMVWTPCHFYTS
jgi:hypothetical protein